MVARSPKPWLPRETDASETSVLARVQMRLLRRRQGDWPGGLVFPGECGLALTKDGRLHRSQDGVRGRDDFTSFYREGGHASIMQPYESGGARCGCGN